MITQAKQPITLFTKIESFVTKHAPENMCRVHPELDTQIEFSKADGSTGQYRVLKEDGSTQDHAPGTNFIRVGVNGHNPVTKQAEYATIDVDCGHGNAQSDETVQELIENLSPHADVVRSTSGGGLHITVGFDSPIPCDSRGRYIAICNAAVAVLEKLSGHKFAESIDKVGCILWVASINQTEDSFEPLSLSNGQKTIPSADVIAALGEQPEKQIFNDVDVVEEDAGHKRILDALQATKYSFGVYTNEGVAFYQTHTCALKQVHELLKLRGTFETDSPGSDAKCNCYIIPKEDGHFLVKSFHAEPTWEISQSDKRHWCLYNPSIFLEDWPKITEHLGGIHGFWICSPRKTSIFLLENPWPRSIILVFSVDSVFQVPSAR